MSTIRLIGVVIGCPAMAIVGWCVLGMLGIGLSTRVLNMAEELKGMGIKPSCPTLKTDPVECFMGGINLVRWATGWIRLKLVLVKAKSLRQTIRQFSAQARRP